MSKPIRQIRIEGNIAFVPLTQGIEAVIDAGDITLVKEANWCAIRRKRTAYAVRNISCCGGKKQRTVSLHRVLMGEPDGVVDHKDGDGLNNRRSNLRVATCAENARNSCISENNTSGFKGVSWNRRDRRWRATIRVDRKQMHLGFFGTPEEAHAAYCAAAKKLHGEFARTK